jgi:hypothetical protein
MGKGKRVINWQLFLGILLVVTGGLFLADQLLGIRIMAYFWPLLIVLFGLSFFVALLIAGRRGAGLAIPGSVITTLGLLFLIQNSFNLWITWAYAWALLISATGLGMLIMNGYLKREGLRRAAGVIIGLGLILFVVFGVLFEIILKIAGTDLRSGVFLGAGLILLGLFIVFSRPLFRRRKPPQPVPAPQEDVLEVPFTDVPEVSKSDEDIFARLSDGEELTRFTFKSVGEVFLIQGDHCDLRIEGDPDLIEKIQTRLEDGELKITYATDIADWTGLGWISVENRLRYYLTVEELSQINLGGAGVIRAERLAGEDIKLDHTGIGLLTISDLQCHGVEVNLGGLGEIRLVGETQSQVVVLSGGGSYQAVNLRSQQADITLTGAGSAKVWVETNLKATVSGAGNILYQGDPQVEQSISGLGGVKPL